MAKIERKSVRSDKALESAQVSLIDEDDIKPKSVDAMSGEYLKNYARKIGISERDVIGLSEDRLRQNCKVRIFQSFEDA